MKQLLFIVFLIVSANTNAVVFFDQGTDGTLFGASGLIVDGNEYSVQFIDGTCAALFDGCDESSDFIFDITTVGAASTVLNNEIFTKAYYDFAPNRTNGIEVTDPVIGLGHIWTPFLSSTFNDIRASVLVNTALLGGNNYILGPHTQVDPTLDFTSESQNTWAVWSATNTGGSGTSVPEPATVLLLMSGLAGIRFFRHLSGRSI